MSQVVIRIDEETKERFLRVARAEGKTGSEKMRELIDGYLRKADLSAIVDDLWERIGAGARTRGVTAADVDRAVADVRKGRRR